VYGVLYKRREQIDTQRRLPEKMNPQSTQRYGNGDINLRRWCVDCDKQTKTRQRGHI